MDDVTVGELRHLRGHWADRFAAIEADIAAIEEKLASAKPAQTDGPIARAIAQILGRPQRIAAAGRHTPQARFQPGNPLPVEFAADKDYASVRLHYRHVNHAERWQSELMQSDGRRWRAWWEAEGRKHLDMLESGSDRSVLLAITALRRGIVHRDEIVDALEPLVGGSTSRIGEAALETLRGLGAR